MDEPFVVFLLVAISLVVGAVIGSVASHESWRNKCEQIGMNISDNKVYDCKVRK